MFYLESLVSSFAGMGPKANGFFALLSGSKASLSFNTWKIFAVTSAWVGGVASEGMASLKMRDSASFCVSKPFPISKGRTGRHF